MSEDSIHLRIIYNGEHLPLLYGHIALFKGQQTEAYRSGDPFVIGKYDPAGRLVVYGSVPFLLQEVCRLIDEFGEKNRKWGTSCANVEGRALDELDDQYNSYVMDFVILASTHMRNLFHLVNNKNITERKIPLRNYQQKKYSEVSLKELFDVLIHNRYYYFDGGVIRDVFSEKFRANSRLDDSRLMGYGIDLFDYIRGIRDVVHGVSVRHFTTILRGKMKNLNIDSKRQEVIFFIQNVHSFSELMKTKIPDKRYEQILPLIFDTLIPAPSSQTTQTILFEAPNIQINPNLNQKAFDITVKCGEKEGDLKEETVTVGYEDLFTKVNKSFGEDRLVTTPIPTWSHTVTV